MSLDRPMYTPAQVADLLQVDVHTVYRMIRDQRLPAIAVSARAYRIRPDDLEAFITDRLTA